MNFQFGLQELQPCAPVTRRRGALLIRIVLNYAVVSLEFKTSGQPWLLKYMVVRQVISAHEIGNLFTSMRVFPSDPVKFCHFY